jgi:hypothetical protein
MRGREGERWSADDGVHHPAKASVELIWVTTHNLMHQVRVRWKQAEGVFVQGVSKKYDKSIVELVQSQNEEHEGNHDQGEDGFPPQHGGRHRVYSGFSDI